MSTHGALSIILEIKKGKKQALLAKLEDYNQAESIPFNKIPELHFARFVVINSKVGNDGKVFPDEIIFSSNYDLPHNDHFKNLATHVGIQLWDIFSECEGFLPGNFNAVNFESFLAKSNFKAATFYVGVGNRSVAQIRKEKELRAAIIEYINVSRIELEKESAKAIRQKIITNVISKPEFNWAKSKAPKRNFVKNVAFYGKYFLAFILFLALSPVIIPFLIIWVILLRFVELREPKEKIIIPKDHIRSLVNRENQLIQAQFSAVGNVKKGFIRKYSVQFLLWLTNSLAPLIFSKGELSGIPTVHFARWLLTHNGQYMIFLSNYDGNSETYLQDFINIATKQLTLLFTHTQGFPETKFLVFKGAKDSNGFMDWARINQTVTNYWYNANPDVSLKNIFNNGEIRNGLYGNMSESQAKKWLSKI